MQLKVKVCLQSNLFSKLLFIYLFIYNMYLLFVTEVWERVFTMHRRASSLQTFKIRCTPLCLRIPITLSAIIGKNLTFTLVVFCTFSTVPTENVATTKASASVIEGVSRSRNALLNGDTSNYDWDSGYTCHQLGSGSIVVQLAQPYVIGSMRLVLKREISRVCNDYMRKEVDVGSIYTYQFVILLIHIQIPLICCRCDYCKLQ